jgi:hypothetical protein
MALQKQNTATANGGACESTHLARRAAQQDTIANSKPQRLISTVPKNSREEFRVGISRFSDGTLKAEIRVFERDGEGNWKPTPRGITIPRGSLAGITAALCEVEARL